MGLPLNQSNLIDAFEILQIRLQNLPEDVRQDLSLRCINENPWFTEKSVLLSLEGVTQMIDRKSLTIWATEFSFAKAPKKVGLIMAGNIPLVGFHDFLTVVMFGHIAVMKLSSKDRVLIEFILEQLKEISPEFSRHYIIKETLKEIDAIIATGSDNSSRYFEYYFKKYPHIIRKNRSSVAILSGKETEGDLAALGLDIFTYFGLGCRNVSKVYVPRDYSFTPFFEAIQSHSDLTHHHKYNNNYDYNKSVLLVNNEKHFDNGFLLLRQSEAMVSPISVLFYEHYSEEQDLIAKLTRDAEKIQCIVANGIDSINSVPMGQAQFPTLWDFADGIDTREFLSKTLK